MWVWQVINTSENLVVSLQRTAQLGGGKNRRPVLPTAALTVCGFTYKLSAVVVHTGNAEALHTL